MTAPGEVVWSHTDDDGDSASLLAGGEFAGGEVLVQLAIGVNAVNLHADAARALRDALNRLLVDDGETGGRQATLEGAYALHAAQHRQLTVAAQHIARQVDYQANALARLADSEPSVSLTVHTILDVHRRTVASLGDLLAALVGQP